MISSRFRFHGHGSLRYVYTKGDVVRGRIATIKWAHNSRRKDPRLSVVVSKKVMKRAVGRNRIRRRVYEYIRPQLTSLTDVYDIVIIITSPEARTLESSQLTQQLETLLIQAKIIETTPHRS